MILRSATSESAREYLLDVAEAAIARDGLQTLTIRALTRAANLNVASVNYFFGTKDSLLLALNQRMLEPMAEERMARLTALAGADRVDIAAAVRALLEPLVRMQERHGSVAVELYRYLITRPDPRMHATSWELLQPGYRRFEELVLAALPDRPAEVVRRRVHLVCELAVPIVLKVPVVVAPAADDLDLDGLVAFIAAGLAAP